MSCKLCLKTLITAVSTRFVRILPAPTLLTLGARKTTWKDLFHTFGICSYNLSHRIPQMSNKRYTILSLSSFPPQMRKNKKWRLKNGEKASQIIMFKWTSVWCGTFIITIGNNLGPEENTPPFHVINPPRQWSKALPWLSDMDPKFTPLQNWASAVQLNLINPN